MQLDVPETPGSERSPGGGHGNPLQNSCLENPVDRGAWWASVRGAAQSQTCLKWLSSNPGSMFGVHPSSTYAFFLQGLSVCTCDPVSCSIFLMKCRGHPSTSVLGHCLHLFNNLTTFHSSAEASSTPSGEGPEYFLAIRKAAAMSFQGVLDRGTLGP